MRGGRGQVIQQGGGTRDWRREASKVENFRGNFFSKKFPQNFRNGDHRTRVGLRTGQKRVLLISERAGYLEGYVLRERLRGDPERAAVQGEESRKRGVCQKKRSPKSRYGVITMKTNEELHDGIMIDR